ncbi:MAG: phosphate signaling complex protein PhoU [Oscillospiraceae bacterium]
MRNQFNRQLELLNMELTTMGALCESAISSATKALLNGNRDMIKITNDAEIQIDQKERDIEALCMKLLLQQQPVASDLRIISSALKMISDMERIGDQASDIAEITKFVKSSQLNSITHISDMAKSTIKMVTDSIESFVNSDLELAYEVMKYDDIVDDLFKKVKIELIELISNKTENAELCLDLLMIAKYLERIGDHAVNIAEWVEFSITGRRIE